MSACASRWRTLAQQYLDDNDRSASYTACASDQLGKVLCSLKGEIGAVSSIVDLGCGYGGLTLAIRAFLGAKNVFGVDIDEKRLQAARTRTLNVLKADIEHERLPFDDESIDLVVSFGVLEHLAWWDNCLGEVYRVLANGGYFLVSVPNLRSYLYVISLLLGFQPRDVEVSQRFLLGVLPISVYLNDGPAGHIHTVTLRAFKELMEKLNFEVVAAKPLRNKFSANRLLSGLDRLACLNASIARRFIVLAKKSGEP